ncbi:UNVERIFIED_CONTAM: putative mitochondrial protein [Sesamum calycinum]|uniref:Mitochondrial protein n=1 Tax=Sesamum calycinum TaxID=2727403 RepID=A0AAW2LRY9_9LAMI
MAESTSTAAIVSDDCQYERDVLYLHPSEHSGLSLSSIPLDGSNFLVWSRSIYVSLGTRMKLGFIDGSFPKLAAGSKTFEQWSRVDLMVISWIWNSISKDIVEAFMYASSSRELWLELQRRYGRSNGPMLYQIQRELSTVSQGDLSVTAYLTKKKKLFIDKRSLVCDHCHKSGHSKDSCFKLHGIPDWYKNLPEQKKKESGLKGFAASVTDVPCKEGSSHQSSNVPNQNNVSVMMAEVLKLVKENSQPSNPLTVNYANYVYDDVEFASNVSSTPNFDSRSWIIDTGATNHICADITLFQSYTQSKHSQFITLPDGRKQSVLYTGTVQLSVDLTLDHVLFIPEFSVNLLSDQNTNKILATGSVHKRLYLLRPNAPQLPQTHVSCFASDQCNKVTWHRRLGHSSVHALKHLSIFSNFPNDSDEFEPKSYKEPVKHPEWQEAMRQEIQALEQNCTWKITPLPVGNKPIGCKWVFKTKLKADGFVERYKVRLVAKGYNQVEGIDYTKSFSPVAKAVNVRIFQAIVVGYAWPIQQLDINNTFFAWATSTPCPPGLKVTTDSIAQLQNPDMYRRLVGRLLYLGFTRPDISHSIQQLNQYLSHPCDMHRTAALHVVSYLKGNPSKGIFLPASNLFQLKAFCDADWASCADTRRSLSGFCIFLGVYFGDFPVPPRGTEM